MSGQLTNERAEAMLAQLAEFYGERVAPVSRYCDALQDWVKAVALRGKEGDSAAKNYAEIAEHASGLYLPIYKSNLLARMIYGGEPLREERCPEHNGHWSGCHWVPCAHGCNSGSNITGWLPARHDYEAWPDDEGAAETRKHWDWDPTKRCRHCGGTKSARVHRLRKKDAA